MLDSIDFSHERDLTIKTLVKRIKNYYPEADFAKIKHAYEFAEKAHREQKRSSGEPYIIHPLNVAGTLVKLKMDIDSIIGGFLHDVVEDCNISPEEIEEQFGGSIAQIVVGLTKISKIKFKTKEENQAENFRKMVVAMAKDIRVIIVKLADRMHNMRTLQYVSKEKQLKVAKETLDIYVPLASRLGINSVKADLEDLCLRYLHTDIYYRLAEKVAMKRSERDNYIKKTVSTISEKLQEYGLKAEIKGRSKHFYSIYKKMLNRGVEYDQIQDLLAFRVIVNNITECYKALGVIHSAFTPIPGRFKDYIAIPKVNNYQSLHTSVIGPKAERIEIQIRTYEMHEIAEAGVAAHWKYKEGISSKSVKLDWIQDLLEFNQNVQSNKDFMDAVKGDLNIGGIFIFTPKGDVQELSYGATPLDFAYSIHTEVGNHCVGAKVNGKMVPLKHRLKSGDTVDILTSQSQTPSKDWLKIVKTSRARTKIKQWLLKIERDKDRKIGEQILNEALKLAGTSLKQVRKEGWMKVAFDELKVKNEDELTVSIGAGKFQVKNVIKAIPNIEFPEGENRPTQDMDVIADEITKKEKRTNQKHSAVLVDGTDDLLVRTGRCCNPIPGDPIQGYITRGRGVTVHTETCERIQDFDPLRSIFVEWNPDYKAKHSVSIRVITQDRPGILSAISKTINNLGVNIRTAVAKSLQDQKGSFLFEIEVFDFDEYLKVVAAIEAKEDVIGVTRV